MDLLARVDKENVLALSHILGPKCDPFDRILEPCMGLDFALKSSIIGGVQTCDGVTSKNRNRIWCHRFNLLHYLLPSGIHLDRDQSPDIIWISRWDLNRYGWDIETLHRFHLMMSDCLSRSSAPTQYLELSGGTRTWKQQYENGALKNGTKSLGVWCLKRIERKSIFLNVSPAVYEVSWVAGFVAGDCGEEWTPADGVRWEERGHEESFSADCVAWRQHGSSHVAEVIGDAGPNSLPSGKCDHNWLWLDMTALLPRWLPELHIK